MTPLKLEILKGAAFENKCRAEHFAGHDFQEVCRAFKELDEEGLVKAIFLDTTNEVVGYVAAEILEVRPRGRRVAENR